VRMGTEKSWARRLAEAASLELFEKAREDLEVIELHDAPRCGADALAALVDRELRDAAYSLTRDPAFFMRPERVQPRPVPSVLRVTSCRMTSNGMVFLYKRTSLEGYAQSQQERQLTLSATLKPGLLARKLTLAPRTDRVAVCFPKMPRHAHRTAALRAMPSNVSSACVKDKIREPPQ
jgi:hypothetical protein